MFLLVASTKDVAGMNIAQKTINLYGFEKLPEKFQGNPVYSLFEGARVVKLVFTTQEIVHTQFLADHFNPQLAVFLSRHSSTSGTPTLSVHTPGNLGNAEFGGIAGKVSVSPASAMKNALLKMLRMKREMMLDFHVSYECTHHGPSLDVPSMFVELGSSPRQWNDPRAAEVVAHAAMAALTEEKAYPCVLGVGGPHYNRKFTRMALNTSVAFGHMIPKYAVPHVQLEVLKQCVQRAVERVDSAVFDWKGMRGIDRKRLAAALELLDVSVVRA